MTALFPQYAIGKGPLLSHIRAIINGLTDLRIGVFRRITPRERSGMIVSYLSGQMGGNRLCKKDRGLSSFHDVRTVIEENYPMNETRVAMIACKLAWALYDAKLLTRTMNPLKPEYTPEPIHDPVSKVNDASTGVLDVPSEITINDLREVA